MGGKSAVTGTNPLKHRKSPSEGHHSAWDRRRWPALLQERVLPEQPWDAPAVSTSNSSGHGSYIFARRNSSRNYQIGLSLNRGASTFPDFLAHLERHHPSGRDLARYTRHGIPARSGVFFP